MHSPIRDFDALSMAEKILHVQDLWDRIATTKDAAGVLTAAQREDLQSRLEGYQLDPEAGSSWEEVRDRVRNGQR